MGFYYTNADWVLKDYATRALGQSKQILRYLSNDELEILDELRKSRRDLGICIAETIFIKHVLLQIINNQEYRKKGLYYIVSNFERIIYSLRKQRDLTSAVIKSFMICKPNDNERKMVERFIKDIRKRVDYLNAIPLPENIKLTPIQDYIDLVGKEQFNKELKTEFPDVTAMIEGQTDGKIEKHITKIMENLKKEGKHELYEERLNKYIADINEKKEKQRIEAKAEKKAYAINEAQNGMLLFMEQFYKGIRSLKGSSKIGLSEQAVLCQLKKGNRGKFIVLCCGYSKGRITYRYMLESGKDSPSFRSAQTFGSIDEAKTFIENIQGNYPERVFQAVVI